VGISPEVAYVERRPIDGATAEEPRDTPRQIDGTIVLSAVTVTLTVTSTVATEILRDIPQL
jgi:hypothetical protein